MRLLRAAGVASLAMVVCACGAILGIDPPQFDATGGEGGSQDGANEGSPGDDGQPGDDGPAGDADGAVRDGDASPNVGYCVTHPSPFCVDFDSDDDASRPPPNAVNDASILIDTTASAAHSPPGSLLAITPDVGMHVAGSSFIWQVGPYATSDIAKFDLWFRVDEAATIPLSDPLTIAQVNFGNANPTYLQLRLTQGGLLLEWFTVPTTPGGTLSFGSWAPGVWTEVAFEVHADGLHADGATVAPPGTLSTPMLLALGVIYNATGGDAKVRFDDITISP
jgi:hypothetical protein